MSTICIHGLGYIGLPTAAMFANYGHRVIGYDTNAEIVSGLQDGGIHIDEPGLRAFVTQAMESEQLSITDEVKSTKYHIICVPTPFNKESKTANLEYVENAGDTIAPNLRIGDTVILESTVPPGTTVGTLKPKLEASGLSAGDDFALVHCPETVLPGNIITELQQNDRIIGGVNGVSTEVAVQLYDSFVEGAINTTSNATTAEFVKLIQNTFRDTNIALANEIAKLAHDYEIDSREAIELANTHPRVDLHNPGPGVGGHCLPIDPWFLGQGSDQLELISKAREVNDGMTNYIIDILLEELDTFDGKKIAILGIAYKGNIGDTRMSPGLRLAEQLQATSGRQSKQANDGNKGPLITINDPHVTDQTLSLVAIPEAIIDADAAVITADHQEYTELDPTLFADNMTVPFVVDSRSLLDTEIWEQSNVKIVRI